MSTERKQMRHGDWNARAGLVHKLELYGALSIVMMFVIFAFSSMNGEISTSQSNSIAFWLAGQFVDGFDGMSDSQKLAAIHSMTYPIRKTAHVSEYAILGGLLTATFWQVMRLRQLDTSSKVHGAYAKAWGLGFACAVLYACTDEFHQTFTPGRTGQPIDVCIDGIGILAGTLFVIPFILRYASTCGERAQGDEET